jgi:aspartate carbamoyltransferase catalytic subunit
VPIQSASRFYACSRSISLGKLNRNRLRSEGIHPDPMNRGLEIGGEFADDPKGSVILKQVTNSVANRIFLRGRFSGKPAIRLLSEREHPKK